MKMGSHVCFVDNSAIAHPTDDHRPRIGRGIINGEPLVAGEETFIPVFADRDGREATTIMVNSRNILAMNGWSYAQMNDLGPEDIKDAIDAETEANELHIWKDPTVRKIAEIIHNSWSTEPFDMNRDSEDLDAAVAVIAAFPKLSK
jgi:hypothetical protein